MWYKLEGDKVVHIGSLWDKPKATIEQLEEGGKSRSRCNKTELTIIYDDKPITLLISTVFLQLSHGTDNDKPIVFETMVFFKEIPQESEMTIAHLEFLKEYQHTCKRYTSVEDARKGHEYIVDTMEKKVIKNNLGELKTQNIMLSL